MFKNGKLQYVIKSVPSDETQPLQNLLNEMSEEGWDLYSMNEVEGENGFQFNCIFVRDTANTEKTEFDDVVNITAFKSQMEKMLSAKLTPYETCKEIQAKIREQKKKIQKIKNQLEKEAPASTQRKMLNDKMSASLKELENLQQSLIKAISPDAMFSTIAQEKFSIHLNEEILEFISPDNEADLLSETVKIRQKLTYNLGYVLPRIVFQDDDELEPFEFSINIRGLSVFNSFVYPKHLMFFADEIKGIKKSKNTIALKDPLTLKNIVWIEEEKAKDFWNKGLTPSEYIARALEFVAIKYIDELLDYTDVKKYVKIVEQKNPDLVEDIIPDFITMADLKYLFVNLLREQVSIRDIVYLFEKINDFSDEPCKEDLLDKIRLALSRFIVADYCNEDGIVNAIELSEDTLNDLFSMAESNESESIIRIEASSLEKIVKRLLKAVKTNNIDSIILVVPMEVRHMLFAVLSQYINNLTVLSKEEVTNFYTYETVAII